MALPTAILVFLATFTLAAAAVWVARMVMDRRSGEAEESEEPAAVPRFYEYDDSPLLRRDAEVSSISVWAWVLERFNLVERVKRTLGEADMDWTVGRTTLSMLVAATVAWAILSQIPWLPFWGLAILGVLAGMGPYFYIGKRKARRWEKIEEQFPDALESLARALRAGHPFAGALDHVASQTPNPLGKELKRTFAEGALGSPWESALENLAERLPMQEVCIFVAAVQMQSKSGGNLSEVLEKLSENMREASALRGEVRAMSGQGRMAGYILSALPVVITGFMFYVNPSFLDPLFTEDIGRKMVTGAVLGVIAAHFVIKKLVDIKL
ncbi:MAG: type II secretion system F family protein [Bryobacterales bacterium]|nr:type II secretion system F family protein [Bryobacterales bacterium]